VCGDDRWSYSEASVLVKGHAALIMVRDHKTGAISLRTYKVGDEAIFDRFNLYYTGTINKITDDFVWIGKLSTSNPGSKRQKRLTAGQFASENIKSVAEAEAHNSRESMYL
jgi:hypothetical protein